MDRAERVAGELMQHTPDSYDSRGERQTAISAILRREFQAVERETWLEAAQAVADEYPDAGAFVAASLRTHARMVGQEGSLTLSARAKEEA